MNRLKTLLLLSTLTALLLWAGHALAGAGGLWFALALAVAMNGGAYWFADRLVLRMYHAQELSPEDAPDLHAMVRDLAARARLPMPRLYLIPEQAPNAFATGRDPRHGIVAVTEGLLEVLDRQELAAVIAHELGHIRHRDTLVMAVAATVAGALSMLANAAMWGSLFGGSNSSQDEDGSPWAGLLGILIAPIAATLVQMSISRTREFLADEAAARFTGAPLALAGALRKIEAWSREIPMRSGSPATAHLFIQNPFRAEGLAPCSAPIRQPNSGWRVSKRWPTAARPRSRNHGADMKVGLRNAAGFGLLAAGVAGLLLPIIPGIPLLLAGAALLGPHHPVVRPVRNWLEKKGLWKPKRDRASEPSSS